MVTQSPNRASRTERAVGGATPERSSDVVVAGRARAVAVAPPSLTVATSCVGVAALTLG